METEVVLDASALIALLLGEPGAESVADRLEGAAISAVNVAEVADRFAREGVAAGHVRALVENLQITINPADASAGFAASAMMNHTRQVGLSLGDRFCLALAKHLDRPALTGDRRWVSVSDRVGVVVELIR